MNRLSRMIYVQSLECQSCMVKGDTTFAHIFEEEMYDLMRILHAIRCQKNTGICTGE